MGKPTGKTVLVLGGGVAGMTAAHELALKGFDVTVLERRVDRCGGKARTQPVLGSGTQGRSPLPGEHGFRFFPGFYRHIDETLAKIPFGNNTRGVLDNLVTCERGLFATASQDPFPMVVHFPRDLDDWLYSLSFAREAPEALRRLGLTNDDFALYMRKMFQIATSCTERRFGEYERTGWWDYVEADSRSKEYQTYLATGITRSAVATKAERANTRTIGVIGLQLALDMMTPGSSADRVLNGPTNEAWLDPWLTELRRRGVKYLQGRTVTEIVYDESRRSIVGIRVNGKEAVTADAYVIALPVEVTCNLLPRRLREQDPLLGNLTLLSKQVEWMNGIQFFLNEELTLTRGHINALDTPWALTALFQQQFWDFMKLDDVGDGTTRSILSVDISAWEVPGLPDGPSGGKCAHDCTADEVAAETWFQLRRSLNHGEERLPAAYSRYWLDDDLQRVGQGARRGRAPDLGVRGPGKWVNAEPLLVNLVGGWALRPEAWTSVSNLFLAGDYVRTHTDFASMEGACEAGRRAALAICERFQVPAAIDIFPLKEPGLLDPFKAWDRSRHEQGLPWAGPERMPLTVRSEVEGLIGAATRGLTAVTAAPAEVAADLTEAIGAALSDSVASAQSRAQAIIARAATRSESIPDGEWLCFQRWTQLTFLSWRVAPEAMRSLVPSALGLDLHDGSAWITLVPMRMSELVLRAIDPPGADNFPELNVRTYVTHRGRRAVYFLRIDCDDLMAIIGARVATDVPYRDVESVVHDWRGDHLAFSVDRGGGVELDLEVHPEATEFVAEPGSLEEFLTARDAALIPTWFGLRVEFAHVTHDPWRLRPAAATIRRNDLLDDAGLTLRRAHPDSILFADEMESVLWPVGAD
ncbi:MAG: FAD-dependent oxidoreductase [Myxococcales bacterium]|nr:FAD-dependent oxidoreductase [Myxococcales bacterium]